MEHAPFGAAGAGRLGRRHLLGAAAAVPAALGAACVPAGGGGAAQAPAGKPQGTVEAWTVWDGTREALMNG